MNQNNYNRGLALLNHLHGEHSGAAIVEGLKDICPDLATMTIEWGFGVILSREELDLKTRELAIIASCVTLGNAEPQLIAHIEAAFKVGAIREEIIEVILQTALYAGFPAVTNSLFAAKHLLQKN